jgi:hypothetical protein
MSSWTRDIPKQPPKKAEEFSRLPKELPLVNTIVKEVLPFPAPSRIFKPGTGQRMVEESTNSRTDVEGAPVYKPISDAAKANPLEVKTFEVMSVVKPRNQPKKFLPRHPEPFVPLSTSNTNPAYVQNVAKSFDNPSMVKPQVQQQRGRPTAQVARTEPKQRGQQANNNRAKVNQMGVSANPQITIVIPLYNGLEFLEEALQSVKRQTYSDWTGYIGVNGHGQTGEPVLSKATDIVYNLGLSNRIQIINLPDVRGAANAINHMVGMSTTPYIAHLDADDLWLSKKLEYQMSVYEQDPTIGIVGAMCRYFGDSNDFKILPPGMLTIDDFTTFNPLIHSSILIKREFAIYSDEFVAYDYDCWVRNIKNDTKIFNINNILVLHRIHSKSFYNTSGKQDPEAIKRKYGLVTPADALVKVN